MKKLLFILAIIAVYGLSVTRAYAGAVTIEKANVTIVADDNDQDSVKEKVKKAVVKTKTNSDDKAAVKSDAGCTGKAKKKSRFFETQKAACAEKGKACCGSKNTEAVPVPKK